MGKNVVSHINDMVPIKTVLISVSDKTGLEVFIPGLLELNPEIQIFSTGGTFGKIKDILGVNASANLTQVSDYTGQPETQGGLVKTLDFKIYLGLLTESYNDAHQDDLERTGAVPIDMVVCNLYPFSETITEEGCTIERARGNIDIGGPTMIRAAAKNFLRVTSVVKPDFYPGVLAKMQAQNGALSLADRYSMAREAFKYTASYDETIALFLMDKDPIEVVSCYKN